MMKKLVLLLFLVLTSACLNQDESSFSPLGKEGVGALIVEAGDTVWVNYILATSDEIVLDTTFKDVAENWGLNVTRDPGPVPITVGSGTILEGVEKGIIGMKVGDQVDLRLSPGEAYGEWNESLVISLNRTTYFPYIDNLTRDEFGLLFNTTPESGGSYPLTYWNATVLEIDADQVIIHNDAVKGRFETDRGYIDVLTEDDGIRVFFTPFLNSTSHAEGGMGRVIDMDDLHYRVDLNHPLAGQEVLFFIRITHIDKPSQADEGRLLLGGVEFSTSLEEGLEQAALEGKPVFLYFHAKWCSWCRKFEKDVLNDPSISKDVAKRFVPVALDVDENPDQTGEFMVLGTPTMVFLSPEGKELERIRGYRGISDFKEIIKEIG